MNYIIRTAILVLAYVYIYKSVFLKENIGDILTRLHGISHPDFGLILLSVSGLLLNWGIETYKWKRMIRKLEEASYFRCLKAVLAGLTFSLFSPNRTGEFLGRIFMLEKAKRIESSIVTIATNFGQLVTTLICGTLAVWIYPHYNTDFACFIQKYPAILVYILPSLLIVLILFLYLNLHKLHLLSAFFPSRIKDKILSKIKVLDQYHGKDWIITIVLSFLRYIVFSIQFILLVKAFIPEIHFIDSFLLISLIFFSLTAFPSIALAEAGIRGSVSIFIFGFYFREHSIDPQTKALAVFTVSTLLWFINIVFPAIIGSFSVFRIKFFRK